MKTEDLMIGDWVLYNKEPMQVRQLGIWGEDRDGKDYPAVCVGEPNGIGLIVGREEIEPIPLTKEILEKNGFCYSANVGKFCLFEEESYSHQQVIIELWKVESINSTELYIYEQYRPKNMLLKKMDCDFVHELQHALRLCGIEKEIDV